MTEIDWPALHAQAVRMTTHSYVPYSKFPVGAAALTTSGRVVSGCNVENAGYGVVLCAECGLVSQLVSTSESSGPTFEPDAPRELILALSCVDGDGTPITPCGRCRQLLSEHAHPDMLVEMAGADPLPFDQLLPFAFGPRNLVAVESSRQQLKGKS